MRDQLLLTTLYLVTGLLFIGFAIPLIAGRVPRNLWYGVRVPKTLRSDDVWYPANRYFGRDFFHCGRILVGGSLLMLIALLAGVPLTADQVATIGLVLTILPLARAVYRVFRFLQTL
jgi:uncharacterized membrane protein